MFGLEPLRRSLEAALRDAGDTKERVRLSAVRDLAYHAGEAEGTSAVAALVRALQKDPSAEVRGAAALSLADAKATSGVDALLSAADDVNVHVRQMAVIALGELATSGDERVVEAIQSALGDGAPALRFQALIAANRLDMPFAEDALLEAMGDPDDEVRHVALRLLEERSTVEGLEVRPTDAARHAAKQRLDDPVLSVRLAAAILLGRAGDRSGAKVVCEGVAAVRTSLDSEDEQAAIVLAGELGLRDAVPSLERRAWRGFGRGRSFAYEARIALAKMGDARARAAIVRGLSAYSRDARTLAVVAAGRASVAEALPLILAMRADESRAEPTAVDEALRALDPASYARGLAFEP
jgi:HEAT repeat protein